MCPKPANVASVTDDGLNGGDPDLSNNSDTVTNQIVAAPDYTISKTNETGMVAPTQQVSYVITAGNIGTQTGTNVVITDTYPVDILTIVDSVGGTVDSANGTITWNISRFEPGQTESFTVVAEVLATANLDTADQLFTNSVSITDDGANGSDPETSNNQGSESDMLLAGAGEPLFLMAVPETASVPPVALIDIPEIEQYSARIDTPNTLRIITTDSMRDRDSGDHDENLLRRTENDILSGGYLLDEFTLPAPEIHCAPHVLSYEYDSDPASLELLDWLQEPTPDVSESKINSDAGEERQQKADATSENSKTSEPRVESDSIPDHQLDNSVSSLQQQIKKEAESLYGSGKKDWLQAFKDAV